MDKENYALLFSLELRNWWFAGRRDLLVRWLRRYCVSGLIADFGCASGSTLLGISRFGTPVGVDMAADALVFARKKTPCCVQARIEWLPFKSGSLDAVCCLDVIEHVDDDAVLMAEVYRVLKPDGRLFFSVPAHRFLWSETDDMLHHKRRYRWSEMRGLLRCFSIERISYWNFFLFLPALASVVARNLLRLALPSAEKKNVLGQIPFFLNRVLVVPLMFENFLVERGFSLPVGVSIVGVARK